MALTVAIQMDPIEKIDIGGDSTCALALEGQGRGHDLLYYGPRDLSFGEGKVTASMLLLRVGTATNIVVDGPAPEVTSCIARELAHTPFPYLDGQVHVTIPIWFEQPTAQ